MVVSELIKRLQELPPNTQVCIWFDGDRYPVYNELDFWEENEFVDLNAVTGGQDERD